VNDRDRFDKFTERARKVLSLAQEEAQRFQHNYIGTEHLLLGLVREGEGVAAKVLSNLGVELNKVRSAVEFIIGRGDRIVLGEIRGGEAFDLLQLLNTGHSGTLSTIHANSAQQGLARFTSCVLQSGIDLPYRAVKTNIADSLNVVVHVERRPGRRYISEVLFINGYDPDTDLFDYGSVFLAKQDHP